MSRKKWYSPRRWSKRTKVVYVKEKKKGMFNKYMFRSFMISMVATIAAVFALPLVSPMMGGTTVTSGLETQTP